MTKEKYKELLTTRQWKQKRKRILNRDGWACTKCGCKENLEVHHIWYIEGRVPWDVPNSFLTTLCRTHHEEKHSNRPIHTFTIKDSKLSRREKVPLTLAQKAKKKKKDRKKANKAKVTWKMSGKDKKLQKRYDALKK